MTTSAPRHRPGDQAPPVPNDGPSVHDLVIAGLIEDRAPQAAVDLIRARRQLGLERYHSLLQAHNGRDACQDAAEELADALCYVRQIMAERGMPEEGAGAGLACAYADLAEIFFLILDLAHERG